MQIDTTMGAGRAPAGSVFQARGNALPVLSRADSVVTVQLSIPSRKAEEATSDDKDKKQFKSVKELVAYLMMLMARWLQEKPGPGEFVKLEDKVRLQALKDELRDLTSDQTIIV